MSDRGQAVISNSSESPEAFAAVLLRVLRSTEAAAERRVCAQSQLSPLRSLLPRLSRYQSGMCRLQWRPSLRPWQVHRRAARPQELPWSPPLPDRSTRRAVLVLSRLGGPPSSKAVRSAKVKRAVLAWREVQFSVNRSCLAGFFEAATCTFRVSPLHRQHDAPPHSRRRLHHGPLLSR